MSDSKTSDNKSVESISTLDDQKEVFDAHRVYSGYYFSNPEMDFVFQWLLGSISTGGCEIGEAFYAAGKIKEDDRESWHNEWKAMGERKEARADKALKDGNTITASENFMLAANYYRSSITFLLPWETANMEYAKKSYDCLDKGGALMVPVMKPIKIPFENTTLPGFFWPAENDGTSRGTILMIGGGECYLTDNVFYLGPQAHKRGYNFVTIDIPGQGLLPAEGQYFRKDSEAPISAALDTILKRPEIDPEKLAVLGISFGGYFAPRAASVDSRIKAVITNAAVIDNYEMFAAMPFSLVSQEEINNTWPELKKCVMENVVWRLGLEPGDMTGQAEATRGFEYDPETISCPVLNIVGEGEAANPIGRRQCEEYLKKVNSNIKTEVITPLNEGAAAHCTGENRTLMAEVVFDWLDDVFDVR